MNRTTAKARELINTLEKGKFYAQCPCCDEPIALADAGLFFLDDFTKEGQELYAQLQLELRQREKDLKAFRKNIKKKSEIGAETTNVGFILERLAPSMKTFKFNHNDCRSLFDPIDYIIFEGLTKHGEVSRLFFSDIKTGNARLSRNQKAIKGLIERKKVDIDFYKPEDKL